MSERESPLKDEKLIAQQRVFAALQGVIRVVNVKCVQTLGGKRRVLLYA
jgi:hypothetical protein